MTLPKFGDAEIQEVWDRCWRLQPHSKKIPTGEDAKDWVNLDDWEFFWTLEIWGLKIEFRRQDDGSESLKVAIPPTAACYWKVVYTPLDGETEADYDDLGNPVLQEPQCWVVLERLRLNQVLDDIVDATS